MLVGALVGVFTVGGAGIWVESARGIVWLAWAVSLRSLCDLTQYILYGYLQK